MDSRPQWLMGSVAWLIAGFIFPSLNPLTNLLMVGLQHYLSSGAGMSDELAQRVAFTIVRIPLTAVLAIVIAAAQCVRLSFTIALAREWVVAAAIGACIATLIFLPTTLVALSITGNNSDPGVRVILLTLPGAGLLAGVVSFLQRRAVRGKVSVPGSFVVASVFAAMLGVLSRLGLE